MENIHRNLDQSKVCKRVQDKQQKMDREQIQGEIQPEMGKSDSNEPIRLIYMIQIDIGITC